MKKKVTIIGLGYVGLPTLLLISNNKNFKVCGYDINRKLLDELRKGKTSINEKSVKQNLKKNINNKINITENIEASDIFIITVPSGLNYKLRQDKLPLYDVVKKIIKVLKEKNLIIIETTSEPGVTEEIKKIIFKRKAGLFDKIINRPKFFLAYCPERVFPGDIFYELRNNPILIGGINQVSTNQAEKFFKNFSLKTYPTNNKIAEVAKLIENSYRNVQIGFVNELSNYAFKNDLDVKEIINLANLHPRINLLRPGIGVGGHCIPIDPYFLIQKKVNKFEILSSSLKANNHRTELIYKIIKKTILNKKIKEVNIYGATYKADVCDFRESPAIKIINKISRFRKIKINLFDPFLKDVNIIFNKNVRINPLLNTKKKLIYNILLVFHKKFKKIKKQKNLLDFTF